MRGNVTAKVLAVAALTMLVASSASAQRGFGGRGGAASLLGRAEVQTELKLT
jgi:hypothetical protein